MSGPARRLDAASLCGARGQQHVWLDLSGIHSARGTLAVDATEELFVLDWRFE